MQLSVWFGDPAQSTIEAYIRAKANSAFARFSHLVSSVELRLCHEEHATGHLTRCSLDLKSVSTGIIHTDETDASGYVAVAKAIRAAQSKLRDTAQRRQVQGRRRKRDAKLSIVGEFLRGNIDDAADTQVTTQ